MKATIGERVPILQSHDLRISVLDGASLKKLATEPNSSNFAIDAHNRQIREITDLSELPKLCSLDVSFNCLQSLRGVHTGKELRELKAYNNKITTLSGLKRNGNLEGLLVHENQIDEITEDLLALVKLKRLWLNGNRLTQVQNLVSCRMLVHLDLSRNQLVQPASEGLESLISLEYLNLSSNKISTIGNLTHLTKLEELNLSCNQLSSLEGGLLPSNLSVLRLNNNKISSLHGFPPYLTRLNELYLHDNSISDLGDCLISASLESLDLRNNRISTTVQLITSLSGCAGLVDLWIQGNPCCMSTTYLLEVFKDLPKLRTLDSMSDALLESQKHALQCGTISQEALLATETRSSAPASSRPGSASHRPTTPRSAHPSRAATPETGVPVFHQNSMRSGLVLKVVSSQELEKAHADVIERLAIMKAILIRVGKGTRLTKNMIATNQHAIEGNSFERPLAVRDQLAANSNQEVEDEHLKGIESRSRGIDAGTDPMESLLSMASRLGAPAVPGTFAVRRGRETQTPRDTAVGLPPAPFDVLNSQPHIKPKSILTEAVFIIDNQIADGDKRLADGDALERDMKQLLTQYASERAASEDPLAADLVERESRTESPRIANTKTAEQRQPPSPRSRRGYRAFRIPTRLQKGSTEVATLG